MSRGPYINSRYRVLRPLGTSSEKNVILVEDTQNNGVLRALKALGNSAGLSSAPFELMDEFQILAKLSHPNIAKVYDFGDTTFDFVALAEAPEKNRPSYFFTMEFIEGSDLFEAT